MTLPVVGCKYSYMKEEITDLGSKAGVVHTNYLASLWTLKQCTLLSLPSTHLAQHGSEGWAGNGHAGRNVGPDDIAVHHLLHRLLQRPRLGTCLAHFPLPKTKASDYHQHSCLGKPLLRVRFSLEHVINICLKLACEPSFTLHFHYNWSVYCPAKKTDLLWMVATKNNKKVRLVCLARLWMHFNISLSHTGSTDHFQRYCWVVEKYLHVVEISNELLLKQLRPGREPGTTGAKQEVIHHGINNK